MRYFQQTMQRLKDFRDERKWGKHHTPKELARAIMIESAELNRNFLWESAGDMENIKEEIADIQIYLLYLADHYEIDIMAEVLSKIPKNAIKYPVNP